jgi:Cu/Ag efflux pump CusA
MLAPLIRFSLSQRLFILLATLLVAALGWMAFRGLPIDAFPDVSSTQVKVIMKAPGMTPEEVESRIAVPIEVEMLGIPHSDPAFGHQVWAGRCDHRLRGRHRHLLGAAAGERAAGGVG